MSKMSLASQLPRQKAKQILILCLILCFCYPGNQTPTLLQELERRKLVKAFFTTEENESGVVS